MLQVPTRHPSISKSTKPAILRHRNGTRAFKVDYVYFELFYRFALLSVGATGSGSGVCANVSAAQNWKRSQIPPPPGCHRIIVPMQMHTKTNDSQPTGTAVNHRKYKIWRMRSRLAAVSFLSSMRHSGVAWVRDWHIRKLMLCDASGAEFGLMQRRGPGVELAQNAWTVAK